MRKFGFLAVFMSLTLALLSTAMAAPAGGKVLIGVSKIVSHPALDAVEKGLQDELAALKINAQYDLQNANGDANTAASIANKFQSEKVTLAVGIATPTAQSLVNTLKTTPVVFSAVTDPVKAGLVKSLTKGEKYVTGVSDMTPVKQQIELLLQIKKVKRLGHIYTSSEENAVVLAGVVKKACQDLGIQYVETTVSKSAEVKQATQSIIRRVDALYVSTDNTVVSAMSALTDVAMKNKVPVMSADPSSAESHPVLAAWGFDYYKMGRATGKMVAEILKGKKPEQLPTRFMTKASDVDLLVNLDVAKKLGLTVPAAIVKSANKVVENGKLTKK
ncbi:ABC transporter substrate-binding protein [Geobacter sulfurreducens]|uniref:ABC transporter, periplasmic substrate-binding protein n=1 Tax=Geobacter sulfurreducens (strain ATCC 51573 / DSM 12127 / PCA) TaxID=243231 RepID=Q74GN6_GEOSL|nr:ABC transporter substrate-binding protein [Geobacter sulfurreducens]AAR33544.2 ABC transporter, periplasmic substrate-binding protein [Geobacter sulfurreducens PCA]UAC04306.1 ABC transporter substrate-binding protein [Geobacter sulfurreducens]HBB68823.1 ABC transporter substrate-binding protein [Geobacter sulfurreducens]HCD96941.1 ABC transporter substrate-binding protein [Geobacter sulfurreducens]